MKNLVVHPRLEYDGYTGSTLGGWLCRDCGTWSLKDDLPTPFKVSDGSPRKKGSYVLCTEAKP